MISCFVVFAIRRTLCTFFFSRFLGQKKVRDEGSACNSLAASEFLSRHGEIVPFLLENLKEESNIDGKSLLVVNPALVPILSILCRFGLK